MTNISLWQYLVIGGTGFLLGVIAAVVFMTEKYHALLELERRLEGGEWE